MKKYWAMAYVRVNLNGRTGQELVCLNRPEESFQSAKNRIIAMKILCDLDIADAWVDVRDENNRSCGNVKITVQ